MTNLENNLEYQKLIADWMNYKELESIANKGRLKTERALLEITHGQLRDKGTTNLPEGLQAITGYSEFYDQDALERLKVKYDDGLSKLPYFPFKQEWKVNTKQISALKELCPDIFDAEMSEALTIKPKKVAFKVKEKK